MIGRTDDLKKGNMSKQTETAVGVAGSLTNQKRSFKVYQSEKARHKLMGNGWFARRIPISSIWFISPSFYFLLKLDPWTRGRRETAPTSNISEVWEGDRLEDSVAALVFVFNCRGSCSKEAEGGLLWTAVASWTRLFLRMKMLGDGEVRERAW